MLDTIALIFAGGTAMSQMETLIRPDQALQLSFQHSRCAHSGLIQDMLDECTPDTVLQLQKMNGLLYYNHSKALQHDFSQQFLTLDLDLTGLLASKRAEASTKGYFAHHPGARGRQLCRVIATPSQEIVCQSLLPGDTPSQVTLRPAIEQTQQILQLSKAQRQRTLLRWDAGFGTDKNINWMLTQDYQILGKVFAHARLSKLRRAVTQWLAPPSSPRREVAIVEKPHRYARKTHQYVVRTPKQKGTWAYGALVTTLMDLDPFEVVDLYDERGGGIETDFRSDRQGLGLSKRRKHRMAAQQILIELGGRAHNLLVWTAQQLGPPIRHYGMMKLVRDAFQVNGYVIFAQDQPIEIGLNQRHPLAGALCDGFNHLFLGQPQMKLWEPVEPL
jgi:Transposase DDE domain group 1